MPGMRDDDSLPDEPLLTEDALRCHVGRVVADDRPSGRELWILFLDADSRPLPTITVIDDTPEVPEDELVANLFWVLEKAMAEAAQDGSVAFVLHRNGDATATTSDRTWAASLQEVGASASITVRGTYLAAAGPIRCLTPVDRESTGSGAGPAVMAAESYVADVQSTLTAPRDRECLVCFLLRMVAEFGCDGTHRWTERWRDLCAPRATALVRRLASSGGQCCDCEVLINVYPDRVPEDMDARPACAGVSRRGSTRPCQPPPLRSS